MDISLIVPVFNEESTIDFFFNEVKNNQFLSKKDIEIIFINDGSTDNTEIEISKIIKKDPNITLINLSRNFGKESALFAGLEASKGKFVVPIDVDLQDPIYMIEVMFDKINNGYDVVLAKRIDRSSDSYIKRNTANLFYKVHNLISDIKIEPNVGDFRMMSRTVVDSIISLSETQLFMKGVLSWIGYNTTIVTYRREKRSAGNTKFRVLKLWNLAIEGITSFSTVPLKLWTYLGLAISLSSFLYAINLILDKLIFGNDVAGYPSIMVSILFLGGIQLIGIGVIGEYLGRVYMETKRRPRYIIRDILHSKVDNNQ
ncbi:glycosyltransferase family 2 protein [Vibrio natriegens]|uniref:Bactoprenol glucosyl transferase n=1 Tax=Vibrio natriegens NBRC 15636 = ATCC 14048 = DSM 759 TaxID=1219067 RepID=A0AAN1CWA5_VIBNA|nr:glycosyltransferase family 2 protein [Vibrio natriegens]ALR14782.1 bactoprenol glucosyl transferase [Vibrio natriegens NBRC 15636 = ATCC 14048 = DSM 759]ANQ13354.1 bactoprenol glucosyl transferase [Vibrio natriegens NBRC 15636 = ATCC 14048 = DSM 759]EPM40751.1 bactoprenol glucosyl transferase [Vibrio natriegens NBRC 15636 = ATCC 14048 = DSM 759]EPM40899.1 bactoprenol glucosyl transferase [Vibrio natriegens NBRC 15636 = ATCC 14048 = DSM 759]MDX6027789.1 glycosyltransferase family 2 protein [